jgi:hypothetical protein
MALPSANGPELQQATGEASCGTPWFPQRSGPSPQHGSRQKPARRGFVRGRVLPTTWCVRGTVCEGLVKACAPGTLRGRHARGRVPDLPSTIVGPRLSRGRRPAHHEACGARLCRLCALQGSKRARGGCESIRRDERARLRARAGGKTHASASPIRRKTNRSNLAFTFPSRWHTGDASTAHPENRGPRGLAPVGERPLVSPALIAPLCSPLLGSDSGAARRVSEAPPPAQCSPVGRS